MVNLGLASALSIYVNNCDKLIHMYALVRPRHLCFHLDTNNMIDCSCMPDISKNMIHVGMAHMDAGGTARIIYAVGH